MKKIILLLFLISIPFAQALESGKAYIVSSININSTGNIEASQSYSLVPQIVVATGSENYAGSVTPFTGCYGGKRYEGGEEKGNCLTGVVNSLNSDSETDALSAAQGKILNDKIADLQNVTRINYLKPTLQTITSGGVTITNNGDGTYTLNGTSTEVLYFSLGWTTVEKGTYKLVGGNFQGKGYLVANEGPFEENAITTVESPIDVQFLICCFENKTFNNHIIKPMLTNDLDATYDDFVSYQDSLATNKSVNETSNKIIQGIDLGKNLLKPNIVGYVGMVKNGNNIVNTLTDTRTSVEYFIRAYKFDSYYEGDCLDLNYTFTKVDEYDYLYFKHNGAKQDIGIWFDISNLENGKVYTISFQENSSDPSIIGGISWSNFQIEEGYSASQYEPYISGLKELSYTLGELQVDVLWENASPMSPFPSQTVEVNSLGYNMLLLETKGWCGNKPENGPRNGSSDFHLLIKSSMYFHLSRTINGISFERYSSASNFHINFSNAYNGSSIDNQYLIPLKIYGIK